MLFVCAHTTTSAQAIAWITGNEYTVFSSTGTVSQALPQPGGAGNYAGQIAEYNQYMEFSSVTGILFFIIDSNVYDRDGFLIADNDQTTDCQICLPISRANVTTAVFPESCDKFWLFFANNVTLLDLSLPNPIHSSRKGYILDWDNSANPFDTYLDGELENFADPNLNPATSPPSGTLNERPYLILPVAESGGHPIQGVLIDVFDDNVSGEKYIAIQSENEPYIYRIDHTGVWLHQQWGSTTYSPGDGLPFYNSIEITKNSAGNILLAASISAAGTMTYPQENLFLFEANQSFVLQNVTALNAHIGGVGGSIGDVVFSPNADYVYFGLEQPPYFGYYRISTDSFGDLSSVMTLTEAQEAGKSQLEVNNINGNPVLMFAGPDGLSYITSPNDPTQSQLIANAIPNANLAQHNSAVPFADFLMLQHQQFEHTYNEIQEGADCCEFNAEQVGESNHKIQGTNTWSPGATPFEELSGVVYFTETIVFDGGSNTTINDLEFRFGPDAHVIIEPGAYVELNGTLWTSSCDLMWPGVTVLGVTNAQHSISQSPMINGNQGYLRMNNSTIEHAHMGVLVGGGATQNGGILRTYDSRFRNNREDVQIRPYMFMNGAGEVAGNRCLFRNTTFITDDALNLPQLTPLTHLALRGVYGVLIGDCSFMNTTPYSTHTWNQRGNGLTSRSASFNLSGTNTPYDPVADNNDATSFYQLQFGIQSWGFNNTLATYRCRYQEFQECAYGIVNFQTDKIEVYENNFSLMTFSPFSGLETMIRGMYITGSTGYEVQQNYFTFDGFETGTGLGIWVDESGPYVNQIRNNTFNRLKCGIYVSNENALLSVSGNMNGLQLLCNTFVDGITDIYRAEKTSMRHNQGGGQSEGNPIYAGNIFSFENPVCTGISGDFRNDLNQYFEVDVNGAPTLIPWQLDYFCPLGVDVQIPVCDDGNGVFDAIPVTDATHSYDCGSVYPSYSGEIPPAGGGRNSQELITEMEEIESEHSELLEYYHSWIDDGTTEASLQLVANAFPSESEFVRDIMLQRFPLSDDVLRTFISRAENYDPWHLTQVFLANSPLHPRFLYQVESSEILSPFFMSLIHAAQEGENPRHELENDLSVLYAKIDHLKQELQHGWLHSWVEEGEVTFPVDSLHQFASYPNHLMQSAAFELYFGNPAAAASHLTSSEKWEDFQVPFALLESLRDSLPLDTLSIASTLDGLWFHEQPGVASFSLALGHAFLGSDWLPNPNFSSNKTMKAKGERKEEFDTHDTSIAIYPNPASDRAMLTYPAEWSGNAQVVLYDVTGRQMFEQQLTGTGVFEMRFNQYPQGMYIIHVIADGKTLGQSRITIQN